jgi:DNA-binding transcriptional LysR family regulator
MSSSILADLDMNLLRVFDVLMQERRVASAAKRLGLSQPAVSNALARLRKTLGDELLTRAPSGMQATQYAQELHASIAPALAAIENGLQAKTRFDPKTAQWKATIAMTDIGEIVFLPRLLERVRKAAPGLQLLTARDTPEGLPQAMSQGSVDLAIGWLPDVPEGFYQRRLFNERYVCIAREAHPLLARGAAKKAAKKSTPQSTPLSMQDFMAAQHIAIHVEGTGHAKAGQLLQQAKHKGQSRNVSLTVPHFLSVPYLVSASDLIATVPSHLANAAAEPFKLRVLDHPMNLPDFQVKLFWHRRVHQDPANQWLRGLIAEFFGSK